MKYLSRTVWLLSLVSLFNDVASEMLIPILPAFLRSIGFSVFLIGILEGLAEAVAGISKGYFGQLSDSRGRRLPFVQLGYALSALAKPVMALLAQPVWVFFARTADRLGKGIRTGARDAMLAGASQPAARARVFGFHRSMDTFGAVLGPSLALVFLYYYPGQYKELFLLAFLPGVVAVSTTFFLKEKRQPKGDLRVSFFSFLHSWKHSPVLYRRLVKGLLIFALFNSSDIFLLLRAKEAGLNDSEVIGVYIAYNMAFAALAFPMGIVADRRGLKPVFIFGILLFAGVYAGLAYLDGWPMFLALILFYAWSAACLDGIARAWITRVTEGSQTGTALGTYAAFQSLCTMAASALMGFLWYRFGATAAFLVSAAVALIIAGYFFTMPEPREVSTTQV